MWFLQVNCCGLDKGFSQSLETSRHRSWWTVCAAIILLRADQVHLPEESVHPTVKNYIWLAEGIGSLEHRVLRRAAESVHSWLGATVVAFDYHQVLDVDRRPRFESERIENFLFPP